MPLGRTADEHQRDAGLGQARGEGILAVEADQDRAVDVAGRQVVAGSADVGRRVRHEQDQLEVAGGQLQADAAQDAWEERVAEQPAGRLGDDHADRVAAAGDQAAGGPVGDVAEVLDGGLDVAADVWADPRRAVDDARDGRPRDAGQEGDLFQGGTRCDGRAALADAKSRFSSRESALTLNWESSRACQESALKMSVAFGGWRGRPSGLAAAGPYAKLAPNELTHPF